MFGSKLVYKLDADKQPKQIDLTHRRPRDRPKHSAQGVYWLQGDTLKICWGYHDQRPTEFAADRQADQHLLIMKRIESEPEK
jgi:uncharacterized protein (TIGR03067 family)